MFRDAARGRALLAVFVTGLMLVSSLGMVSASNFGDEVSIPNIDYWPPPNSAMMDSILGMTNTSIYGRPLFVNETTGDLYYSTSPYHLGLGIRYRSNGTNQVLNESIGYTEGTSRIYGGLICDDGSMLISVKSESVVLRSEDGGRTFTTALTTRLGQVWHMAKRGDYVYAGEYAGAEADAADLWMSTDNGKSGTWSVVLQTAQTSVYQNHWHVVYTDPYTDNVWAAFGDGENAIACSTDGLTFSYVGAFNRATAIAADENCVYFGDDTPNRVIIHNKTTKTWVEQDMLDVNRNGPVYNIAIGEDGVLYARSVTEGISNRLAGIHVSPDGITWNWVINLTGVPSSGNGDSAWFGMEIVSDGFGTIYWDFKMPTADTADRGKVWLWTMEDISRAEAYALDGSWESDLVNTDATYTPENDGFDGQSDYVRLGRTVLYDCYLNVVGQRDENLARNGTIPSEWDLNHTWPYNNGWAEGAEAGEADNLTMGLSVRNHSAPYSLRLDGTNSSANHGKVRLNINLPTAKRPSEGHQLAFSFYYSIVMDPLVENSTDVWPSFFQGKWLVYYSDLTVDTVYVAGVGAAWQNQSAVSTRGNQTYESWQRGWAQWTIPAGKTLGFATFDAVIVGEITVYIDDIQLINGTRLTPAMAGIEYVNETSEDINITLDGTTYQIGTLEGGESVSIPLTGKVLSGLVPFSATVNGSRHFTWNITGTRGAASWNALISEDGGVVEATHLYSSPSLALVTNATIDVPSFLGTARTTEPILYARLLGGHSNLTFSAWSTSYAWNDSAAGQVRYTLTGLSSAAAYTVTQNGEVLFRQAVGSTTLTFEAVGGGAFIISVEPTPPTTQFFNRVYSGYIDTTNEPPFTTQATIAAFSTDWGQIAFGASYRFFTTLKLGETALTTNYIWDPWCEYYYLNDTGVAGRTFGNYWDACDWSILVNDTEYIVVQKSAEAPHAYSGTTKEWNLTIRIAISKREPHFMFDYWLKNLNASSYIKSFVLAGTPYFSDFTSKGYSSAALRTTQWDTGYAIAEVGSYACTWGAYSSGTSWHEMIYKGFRNGARGEYLHGSNIMVIGSTKEAANATASMMGNCHNRNVPIEAYNMVVVNHSTGYDMWTYVVGPGYTYVPSAANVSVYAAGELGTEEYGVNPIHNYVGLPTISQIDDYGPNSPGEEGGDLDWVADMIRRYEYPSTLMTNLGWLGEYTLWRTNELWNMSNECEGALFEVADHSWNHTSWTTYWWYNYAISVLTWTYNYWYNVTGDTDAKMLSHGTAGTSFGNETIWALADFGLKTMRIRLHHQDSEQLWLYNGTLLLLNLHSYVTPGSAASLDDWLQKANAVGYHLNVWHVGTEMDEEGEKTAWVEHLSMIQNQTDLLPMTTMQFYDIYLNSIDYYEVDGTGYYDLTSCEDGHRLVLNRTESNALWDETADEGVTLKVTSGMDYAWLSKGSVYRELPITIAATGNTTITPTTWDTSGDQYVWTGTADAGTSVTYTLSGLTASQYYEVWVDGVKILTTATLNGSFTFTHGSWSSHLFLVQPSGSSGEEALSIDFTVSKDKNKVVFTSITTGTPTSIRWSFGDGTGSEEWNPTHIYASKGLFTVTAIVTDSVGNTERETKIIDISELAEWAIEDDTLIVDLGITTFVLTSAWAFIFGIMWIVLSAPRFQRLPFIGWLDSRVRFVMGAAFFILGLYLAGVIKIGG